MVFVDDFSGAFGVYFLKNKSDATRATEQFLADTSPYGSVKRLRSDNGGEYISEEFKSLLLKTILSEICPEMQAVAKMAILAKFRQGC